MKRTTDLASTSFPMTLQETENSPNSILSAKRQKPNNSNDSLPDMVPTTLPDAYEEYETSLDAFLGIDRSKPNNINDSVLGMAPTTLPDDFEEYEKALDAFLGVDQSKDMLINVEPSYTVPNNFHEDIEQTNNAFLNVNQPKDMLINVQPSYMLPSYFHGNIEQTNNAFLSVNQPEPSNTNDNLLDIAPLQDILLNEPNPLGLHHPERLSLDLIENTDSSSTIGSSSAGTVSTVTPERKSPRVRSLTIPATLLQIGSWQFVSLFPDDLLAKCSFAKQKLIWEFVGNGMARKIEIQFSDITALTASLPSDGPGTLYIRLGSQPSFFEVANPLVRRHTSWHYTSDFTDRMMASKFRTHVLQFQPGVLNRGYEKMMKHEYFSNLRHQTQEVQDLSPYFHQRVFVVKNPSAPTPQERASFRSEGSSSEGDGIEPAQLSTLRINTPISNSIFGPSEQGANGNSPLDGASMVKEMDDFLLDVSPLLSNADQDKVTSIIDSLSCLIKDPNAGPSSNTGILY